VAFEPDGRSLASGSRDGAVKVWNVPGGPGADVLSGHDAQLAALAVPQTDMPEVARASDRAIDLIFLAYPRRGDFIAADMARELLRMGFTWARPAVRQFQGRPEYDPAGRVPDVESLGRVLRDRACAGDRDEERAAR
jgi:hypothetical protein